MQHFNLFELLINICYIEPFFAMKIALLAVKLYTNKQAWKMKSHLNCTQNIKASVIFVKDAQTCYNKMFLQTEVGWGWNAKTIDVLLKRKMVRH